MVLAAKGQGLGQFAIGHQGADRHLMDAVDQGGCARGRQADPGFGADIVVGAADALLARRQAPRLKLSGIKHGVAPVVQQGAEGIEGRHGLRVGIFAGEGPDVEQAEDLEIHRLGAVGNDVVFVLIRLDLDTPALHLEQVDGRA